MISIKNLTVAYSKNKAVINDLSCELERGAIHGIVGLNGAGKTTLIHSIFGLIKPLEGEVLYLSEKISKKDMAYLPTDNFFYSRITGAEYLKLFENTAFNIDDWNSLFNLPLNELIETYSTGMKKKIALLALLKKDKPIMILDEPFNGLDLETTRIIRSVLLRLKTKGKTIIVTSHILETLTNMCDYIHFLEGGCIKKSIEKVNFSEFEKDLLRKIEDENRDLINQLLQ